MWKKRFELCWKACGARIANAFFDGIMRARNFYRLVLDINFPFIRLIKAMQHIHERCFASAIFI